MGGVKAIYENGKKPKGLRKIMKKTKNLLADADKAEAQSQKLFNAWVKSAAFKKQCLEDERVLENETINAMKIDDATIYGGAEVLYELPSNENIKKKK
jgi:superfamily II helicase